MPAEGAGDRRIQIASSCSKRKNGGYLQPLNSVKHCRRRIALMGQLSTAYVNTALLFCIRDGGCEGIEVTRSGHPVMSVALEATTPETND
jgi:hypothetical protein